MSVAQVTQEIARMTEDEQFCVAAFLQHLVDERNPTMRMQWQPQVNVWTPDRRFPLKSWWSVMKLLCARESS
jgi:hypothetical protein